MSDIIVYVVTRKDRLVASCRYSKREVHDIFTVAEARAILSHAVTRSNRYGYRYGTPTAWKRKGYKL